MKNSVLRKKKKSNQIVALLSLKETCTFLLHFSSPIAGISRKSPIPKKRNENLNILPQFRFRTTFGKLNKQNGKKHKHTSENLFCRQFSTR